LLALNKKQAQILVDSLALQWGVPPIKVVVVPKKERAPGVGVYFSDAPDWHIGITNTATEEKVRHEFGHYLAALMKLKDLTEEKIVNALMRQT
jgi:hypothetical protein